MAVSHLAAFAKQGVGFVEEEQGSPIFGRIEELPGQMDRLERGLPA